MADAKMRTLTINGKKFVVDDADAVQLYKADGSPPSSGTVPKADGSGGVEWAEPVFLVTATPGEDMTGECSVDRTVEEVWAAITAGKTVMAKIVIGGKEGIIANVISMQLAQAVQYFDGAMTAIVFSSVSSASMTVALEMTRSTLSADPVETAEIKQLEAAEVPDDGTDGQVLTKTADGFAWQDAPEELPEGGTDGQILTKTANGSEWKDAPKELPSGGSSGQILTRTANGAEWKAAPTEIPADGADGQILTKSGNKTVWQDAPVALPEGGTQGQVLTIGADGSASWADPVTVTSSEGVLF